MATKPPNPWLLSFAGWFPGSCSLRTVHARSWRTVVADGGTAMQIFSGLSSILVFGCSHRRRVFSDCLFACKTAGRFFLLCWSDNSEGQIARIDNIRHGILVAWSSSWRDDCGVTQYERCSRSQVAGSSSIAHTTSNYNINSAVHAFPMQLAHVPYSILVLQAVCSLEDERNATCMLYTQCKLSAQSLEVKGKHHGNKDPTQILVIRIWHMLGA